MSAILIAGGFGYLGGRVAQFLSSQTDHEILLGSRQPAVSPDWLPQAKVVQIQWESQRALSQICAGVDAVVHLAGMNARDCAANPVMAVEVNASATARLLHSAIRQGVRRFIYSSTAHVYGSPLRGIVTEETCPVSLDPYATSHRAGEDVVRAAHQRGEIEGIVIRLSNSFGAPAHKDVNCWMLLVNDLCRQALTTQNMVLHSSGMQRRDFITMTDASRAVAFLLESPVERLGDGLFNVGGGWSPTILEMAHRLAESVYGVTGNRPAIQRKAEPEGQSSAYLEYRIGKLNGAGFKLSGDGSVDQELDRLVRFCQGPVA